MSIDVVNGVGTFTISHPPANALSYPLVEELEAACDAFDAAGVKVAVLCSAVPGFFVAGADLKLLNGLDLAGFMTYLDRLRAVLDRIEASSWVSIAAIDGFALGGGLELALACTFRVATARSKLGVPEVKLGLLPGGAGTQRLPRMIPRGPALDLLLTGRSAGGEEAKALGFIDRLAGDGEALAAAGAWAAEFAAGPGGAYAAIKRCADAARDLPFEEGLDVERLEIVALFDSADGQEGVRAFVEKRKPNYA